MGCLSVTTSSSEWKVVVVRLMWHDLYGFIIISNMHLVGVYKSAILKHHALQPYYGYCSMATQDTFIGSHFLQQLEDRCCELNEFALYEIICFTDVCDGFHKCCTIQEGAYFLLHIANSSSQQMVLCEISATRYNIHCFWTLLFMPIYYQICKLRVIT